MTFYVFTTWLKILASKNHRHSVNNPYSQFRDGWSVEEVLKAPKITNELTKFMCSPTSVGYPIRQGLRNLLIPYLYRMVVLAPSLPPRNLSTSTVLRTKPSRLSLSLWELITLQPSKPSVLWMSLATTWPNDAPTTSSQRLDSVLARAVTKLALLSSTIASPLTRSGFSPSSGFYSLTLVA